MLTQFCFYSMLISSILCFNHNEMFGNNIFSEKFHNMLNSDMFSNNMFSNNMFNNTMFSNNMLSRNDMFNNIHNDQNNDNQMFSNNINHNNNQFYVSDECHNRVHRRCVQIRFTEEEVENVRIYLQKRFSKTNPMKPVCKRLRVRKDIKCLTHWELSELISGFQELYRRGIMDKFSLIHAAYWPATHKFAEGIPWHRWHVNQIEKELRKINPRLTMPYWESYSDFAEPEKSIIWDYFGRAGHSLDNYCVTDGAFAYQTVKYPKPHCFSRQWNTNGTIPPFESPEWITSLTQTAQTWDQYVELIGFTGHFKLHLSIGGFYGDYSTPFATNDPIFYIFHAYPTDLALLKWQLSDDNYLVPQSYSEGMRLDPKTQMILPANIDDDYLSFYDRITVREAFQVGFGELCYIHDQLIRPINDMMKNIRREPPIAIRRLMGSLPATIFSQYFPKFAAQNATFFDHFLPDVGNCPVRHNCQRMPIALPYNTTPNGRRQLDRFRFDAGLDLTPLVFQAETAYYEFSNDLLHYDYCSPYV